MCQNMPCGMGIERFLKPQGSENYRVPAPLRVLEHQACGRSCLHRQAEGARPTEGAWYISACCGGGILKSLKRLIFFMRSSLLGSCQAYSRAKFRRPPGFFDPFWDRWVFSKETKETPRRALVQNTVASRGCHLLLWAALKEA